MPRRSIESELADNPRIHALVAALDAAATDPDLLLRFMRDLMTSREMLDVANRWVAAQELMAGRTQIATAREIGLSNKTVNEIAQWVDGFHSTGGYRDVAARLAVTSR